MSQSSSIQRLPVEVDPFRLVDQGRLFDGRIPLKDFLRIQDLLFSDNNAQSDAGEALVEVHLEFTRTDTKLPIIKGSIKVELQMICQRCLKAKEELLNTNIEVVLVESDEQAERLQEGFDTWLVEDQSLFIKDFLEDEMLLALPLVIAHEECRPAKVLREVSEDEQNAFQKAEEQDNESQKGNPFAILKDLKLD